jgi:hypothetical protein
MAMKRSDKLRWIPNLIFGVLSLTLIGAAPRQVQNNLTFSALEVDLWPEYDRPSVLVIYHITLPSDTELPVDLILRIPSAVGEPNAVAVRDANGGLLSIAYTREVNGEWSMISFTPTMPEIQVEYYDPSLVMEAGSRHYEYSWPGDYAVDSLTVEVQQPVGATDMRITPGMSSGTIKADGLTYYTSQAGSLPAGQEFGVVVDYQKSTSALSAESLQIQPSAPVSTITPARRNLLAVLPWILGGLGVVLIVGGGGWWYWQSGLGKSHQPKAPRRRRKLVIAQPNEVPEGDVYCHHCGKRALAGDRFCRTCGTRLRT